MRLFTSFPKSAFLEYTSYETQQMNSRQLPSSLTLLSSGASFIPVRVTHFILLDLSAHVFALSFYSHLNHKI